MKGSVTILTIVITTFFSLSFSSAQNLSILWDEYTNKKFQLFDFIQTNDGQILGVGESLEDGKNTYAAIFYFDSLGVYKSHKNFGAGRDGFRAITQTHEGTLLMVGWTETRNKNIGRDGWVLEMDMEGNILKDTAIGTNNKDIFEKVVIKEDGTALIGGYRNQDKPNGLWLINYSRKKGFSGEQEVAQNIKSVIAMMPVAGNKVLISGNTKNEEVWRIIVEKNLSISNKPNLGGKSTDVLINGLQTYDDKLLLTGQTYSKGNAGSNAWLIELDSEGNALTDEPLGGAGEERSVGAVKVMGRKFALVVEEGRKTKNIVWLHQPNENALTLPDAPKMEIIKVINLYGSGNEFLIVGNVIGGKQKPSGVRLIKIIDTDYLASKDDVSLQCSTPQLTDDSQDTAIGPDELGNINFTLTNPSSSDITNVKIFATCKNPVSGLKYQEIYMVSYVASKGKKTVNIPVSSAAKIGDGVATIDFIVKVNGQEVCRTVANVKCMSRNTPRTQKIITLISPTPSNRAERSEKPEQIINVKVHSNRPLSNTDIKVSKNKKVLKDSKAPQINIGLPSEADGFLLQNITINVPLDTGINVIEIGVEDDEYGTRSTEKITVEYAVHKPTLHIIAIAPTYNNLKYNQKDVNDLLNLLAKQQDSGIYERIIKRPMLTRDSTSLSSIKAVFEELSNDFETGRIHPTDVLMVYYSGHGKMVKNEFRLLPSDYRNNAENTTTIHYENDILKYLKEIKCKKVVLLDACHSGASGAKDEDFIKADDLNSAIDRLNKSAPGMMTISSCSQSELSYESDEWRNSAFSKALCEAFKNDKVEMSDKTSIHTDMDNDGLITLKEMIDFVKKRVPDLVKQKKGVSQTPYVPKGDFDESLRFWRVAN